MSSPPSPPNPFADDPSVVDPGLAKPSPQETATGRDAYNIVSDIVVGMNVRKSDNWFQVKVMLVCVLLGAPVGAVLGAVVAEAGHRGMGVLAGGLGLGFVGVVLGLFGSGIYLMIYRFVRHLQGKHD